MKGVNYMEIVQAIIAILIVFVVAFLIWDKFEGDARKSANEGIYGPGGIAAGLALIMPKQNQRKKGIVLTTNLLTMVVMVVIVVFILFMLFGSFRAETGSSSSSFYFNIFDAIMAMLPW